MLKPITTCLLGLILASCSHTGEKTSYSQNQACSHLQEVLSQADNRFKSLKGVASTGYGYTRWDTKPILPETDCDIIDWGGGRTNFACLWSKGDEVIARNDYAEGLDTVQHCLGTGWHSSNPAGQTGKATLFYREGNPTTVEVRYFKDRDPSNNWQTSLTIGPPVTRDAR